MATSTAIFDVEIVSNQLFEEIGKREARSNPKLTPLELQATVPEIMIPVLPIIEEGEKPFAMLEDLWIKHRDWVFEPLHYSSLDALVGALDKETIGPAEARFDDLVVRKAEKMKGKHV